MTIHRIPATIIGVLIAAVALTLIVGCPSVAPAAEYALPFRVGGEMVAVDTEASGFKTGLIVIALIVGAVWYFKGRKGDTITSSLMKLWGKMPGEGKPVSMDVTVNYESGEPYKFHLELGRKR